MASKTDPALELAELCEALRELPSNIRGEQALQGGFQADAWSPEFYQILFVINGRFAQLKHIITIVDLDKSIVSDADWRITNIQKAFSKDGMVNDWSHSKAHYINDSMDARQIPIAGNSSEIRIR